VSTYQPRVHIRDPKFPGRALCGRDWSEVEHGGRVATSGLTPPVVVNDESGSVSPANCWTCLLTFRKRLKAAKT
jgi:hypothetical protein